MGSLADDSIESEYITHVPSSEVSNVEGTYVPKDDDDWLFDDDHKPGFAEEDFGEFGIDLNVPLVSFDDDQKEFNRPHKLLHLIPEFDDTVSNVSLNPFLHAVRNEKISAQSKAETIATLLTMRGWPAFRIKPTISTFLHGSDTNKRPAQLTVMKDRKKVNDQFLDDIVKKRKPVPQVVSAPTLEKGSGHTSTHWRVPYDRSSFQARKPTAKNFSQTSYRRWASFYCYSLSKRIRRGTQFVSGNQAAETLWYMTKYDGRKEDLQDLIDSVYFYIDDYENSGKERGFTPVCNDGLMIRGVFCNKPSDLQQFTPLFVKDRPVFRITLDFLSAVASGSDLSVFDVSRIQRTIDIKINKEEQVKQGNTSSAPGIHVRHHIEKDNIPEIIEEVLGEAAYERGNKIFRPTVQIISFLVSLLRSTDPGHAVSSLIQFVSGNDLCWDYCCSKLKFVNGKSEILVQGKTNDSEPLAHWMFDGVSDAFSDFKSLLWEAIVGAGVFTFIQNLMSDAAKWLVEPIKEIIASTRVSFVRETGKSFALTIMDTIKSIFRKLYLCYQTRSFAPLWGESWDPTTWSKYCETYEAHYIHLTANASSILLSSKIIKELKEQGSLPDFWTEPVDMTGFIARCDVLLMTGLQLAKYFSHDDILKHSIVRCRNKLLDFVMPLRSKLYGNGFRVQPFALLWAGKARAGKTNLNNELMKAFIAREKLSRNCKFDWRPNVNFQTGLDHTCAWIAMDDIDQTVAPLAAGTPNHIESFIAVVNNNPMPVEGAAIPDKGKLIASPVICTITTNYDDFRAPAHVLDVDTFWCRLNMHVTLTPLPAFTKDGGGIDPASANASLTWDMYDFWVRYPDRNVQPSNREAIKLTAGKHMRFTEFIEEFYSKYDAHMKIQRELVAAISSCNGTCPVCFMDLRKDCGHVLSYLKKLQEDVKSIAPSLVPPVDEGVVVQGQTASALKFGCKRGARMLANLAIGEAISIGVESLFGDHFWLTVGASLVVGGALASMITLVSEKLQGRVANSVEGLVPFNWLRAEQTYVPGVPPNIFTSTYTKEDLIGAVARNFIKIQTEETVDPKAKRYLVSGVILSHNTIIFPTHVGSFGDSIRISCQKRDLVVQLTEFNCKLLMDKELSVAKIPGIIGLGSLEAFIWKTEDSQISQFDELMLYGPDRTYTATVNKIERSGPLPMITSDCPTIIGDCGSVYIGRIGKHWKIIGMHWMVLNKLTIWGPSATACGALMSTLELERLVTSMATTLQGVTTEPLLLSKKGQVQFHHFPAKSEVWAAMSHHGATPYCFGTLDPPLSGSTMKTKLLESLIAFDCKNLIEEWTGRFDYWSLPEFRGEMHDGKWTSPYTDSFATENTCPVDWDVMWMSIADFVNGMQELDFEGYAELSEEQTLKGVPGSFIHRVNVKTSVGPPFNQSKQMHLAISGEDCHMSPELCKIIDALRVILLVAIPAAIAICTLKDEATKPDKMPRVFQVLSFAFNFILKQKGSAWKSFMRSNPDFFESCVGINMTGAECAKIVEALRTISENLDDLYDADVKRIDKSFSGDVFEAVALVIYALSWMIGVCPMDNYHLAQGLKHTRSSIKNDLFCCFWNASGNDWTVEINGILMSIGERYVFYKTRPDLVDKGLLVSYMTNFFSNPVPCVELRKLCIFRMLFILRTYGDDALFATKIRLPANYLALWESIGIIKTDADKTNENLGVLKKKNLSEVQFLKRKIEWNDEFGRYTARLDKKSLARLLAIKKESTLSVPDHACEAMTECLRELVYHSRQDYDRVRLQFLQIAADRKLTQNGYLFLPEFDHYKQKVLNGTFSTWVDRSEVLAFTELGQEVVEICTMSIQGIVKGGNVPAPTFITTGDSPTMAGSDTLQQTDITYDVGYVMSSGTHYADTDASVSTYEQRMPKNALTDYLSRFTELQIVTFSNGNASGTSITSFDPWALFLANTQISSKTSTFSYIRGTMELMFVSAFPANSYGAFTISAYPLGLDSNIYNTTLQAVPNFYSCLQTDHCVKVDVSGSSNVTVELPYIWPYDFASITTLTTGIMWKVYLWSLSPVATAIPGGVTSGSITVYGRLLPDYEMVVPVVQGDHPRRHLPAAHPAHHLRAHEQTTQSPVEQTTVGVGASSAPVSSGKISGIAGKVANVADKLAKVPVIGPYAEVASKAAGEVKKIASWFGFTRDDHEVVPTWVNGRPFSNPAHFDGEDTSDIVSLVQNNAISIDPRFGGGNQSASDPCDFGELFQHWTLIKTMTWAPGATAGSSLGYIPVTPFFAQGSATTTTMTWHPTVAGYIGYPFTYWRGDMEYMVVIPVSKLHRGTLQIYWSPFQSGATGNPTNQSLNMIYDVAADEERQFRVGYAREVPYLEINPVVDGVTTIVPLGACNGRLFFSVVNPLTSQNAASSVNVLVFARAGKNMDFVLPRGTLPMYNSTLLEYTNIYGANTITYQGASGDEETGVDPMVDLVPSSGEYASDMILFGEKCRSVRALLQKPSFFFNTTQGNTTFLAVDHGNLVVNQASEQSSLIFSTHYAKLFMGIAGSFRYKLLDGATNNLYAAYTTGPGLSGTGMPISLSPMSSFQTGPYGGAEFKIPYFCNKKYLNTRGSGLYISAYSAPQCDVLVHTPLTGSATTAAFPRLMGSWGPDVRPGCFAWIPTLTITFNSTATATLI